MSTDPYIPLHVHTHYSLLDGLSKPKQLVDRCVEYGIPACAITDHANLFGALDFYGAARDKGVKPIIGCEAYVSPTRMQDKSARSSRESGEHLVLYCRNETGYHNLCKISSVAHLEGWHYKPRVDDEVLAKYSEGLMASSACLGGRIPRLLLSRDIDGADRAAAKYIEIFGRENFFIEMMNHGMAEEEQINPLLHDLARRHGLLAIATNDSHYTDRADAEAQEVLLCIQTGKTIDDPGHFSFPNNEFYFRSPDEMRGLFARWPDALANTLAVAERCQLQMPKSKQLIPDYQQPEGFTKREYLTHLVMQGLRERYGDPPPATHMERALFEIEVIDQMKFVDYFLVVWDLIAYARTQGIPVGPGRGSGGGSIVAYTLHITNIEPMRYKLLFERFLIQERVSMPDFDIDFCFNRRGEMIEYARNRYGAANVSQIATFGRMLMKNVVRNVGRVLNVPLREVDRIAKMLPTDPKMTLKDAFGESPELKGVIEGDPQMTRLWHLAVRLEGTINSVGTHAAGVVICDHDLTDHTALYQAANSATVATQAEMKSVEKIGLLKMDFLGLRTLTVVHDAVGIIAGTRGVQIDIDAIEATDAKAYELLRSGMTTGVFQLESSGMRDLARRIGLESLEEMSALVALYRPGPMQFIDRYIECKFHPERVVFDHPCLEDILKETYGIPVYQEQVMQMVQTCGGFSLGHADIVRRAMGKKNQAELDAQKAQFIEGCAATQGIDKKLAEVLWSKIETFAGYGFNKSHSVAYAFVAYQTAYLKANYPVEYMCALLTSEIGDLEKAALYIEECRRMDIPVLPPDVNHSRINFSVENNAIRFGLVAIRNLGEGPAQAIEGERAAGGPYKDIYDFCKRIDSGTVNARVVESLNKAGAFAGTGWNRRQVAAVMEKALNEGQVVQRDRAAGQTSLFDMGDSTGDFAAIYEKPELPEWADHLLWEAEKEMLGLYISSHPLRNYRDLIQRFTTLDQENMGDLREGEEVTVAGIITGVRRINTKKGGRMAFLALETLQGTVELTVFTDLYEKRSALIEPDMIVLCVAKANYRDEKISFLAEEIMHIDDAERQLTRAIHVRISPAHQHPKSLEKIGELLSRVSGPHDVYLHCMTPDAGEVVVHAPGSCRVAATRPLRAALEDFLGEDTVFFSAGMRLPSHQPKRVTEQQQPRWRRQERSDN